jgi:hypothetical protein
MGWLKDLMRVAEPAINGYGALARRSLEHSEWPEETRPQPRSLAALYSKLDRGIELEWLAEREAVQRTLALALGCPLESVRRPLEALRDADDVTRLRFDDLPFARPFDFREEPLPPGIPDQVTRPSSWRRLWWLAPSGSGRSLAGRWLGARGLAAQVSARSWAEAVPQLPPSGPVFVELERSDGLEGLDEGPSRVGLCIAAPLPPPPPGPGQPASTTPWELIESPSVSGILGPLLAWVEARLPEDGAFQRAAAQAWLERPVAEGRLPTLGALLGACGVLDARGVQQSQGKSLGDLAAVFVHERLEQATTKGSAEAQWLKRHGFDVLVKLAEEVLIRGSQPWEVARSQDEWIELVPAEFRNSVDAEWMRWSLARSGGESAMRDVERALRGVPPGAYRIVRALVDARLLRSRSPQGRLAVSPEFLRHAALERAREQLVTEGSPFSWGEALLRPHAAPSVLDALYARLARGDFTLVDNLLELDLASQPALVAATEAVFVCLGLLVLSGTSVPNEHVTGIWNQQLRWLVELPGELPCPRLLSFTRGAVRCPLADVRIWSLAALALSGALGAREGAPHPLLRPWGQSGSRPELTLLLDGIYAALLEPELRAHAWAVEAFAMVGRLSMGDAGTSLPTLVHPLARPTLAVRVLLEEDAMGALLDAVGHHALEVAALRAECDLRRVSWQRMAHAVWKSWYARGCPSSADALLGPESSCREHFWPHLPGDLLDAVWARWAGHAWPLEYFGPNQWSSFVERWARAFPKHAGSPVWAAALERLDIGWLERVLGEARLSSGPVDESAALLSICWRRAPAAVIRHLLERLAANDADALCRVLFCAPARVEHELLLALNQPLSERTVRREVLDETRRWLRGRVAARGEHWRDAYELLTDLEERVARSLRARGQSTPA